MILLIMSTLEERFTAAIEKVKTLSNKPDNSMLSQLYSYYKQATVGPCNIEQPWAIQVEARAKWDAWDGVRNVSKEKAMTTYIMLVDNLLKKNV